MIFFELFSNNPDYVLIPAGEALFEQGERGHLMYVLINGEADVVINSRPIERLQRGNIVGEMSMVSPEPHSASVVAKSDCQFVAINEQRFQYLTQQTPFFAMQVMRVMAERLRRVDRLIHV